MDIVICRENGAIEHTDTRAVFSITPRKLKIGDRIYIVNSQVQKVIGSYEVTDITTNFNGTAEIIWDRSSWEPMKEKERSSIFPGFRYKWWWQDI